MKVRVENLGVLKQAEFELGDLTIICGDNNTGKTYATYALFGFLNNWEDMLRDEVKINNRHISALMNKGTVRIDVNQYVKKSGEILENGCREYSRQLSKVFASRDRYFQNSRFHVDLEASEIEVGIERAFVGMLRSPREEVLSLSKLENSTELIASMLVNTETVEVPREIIKKMISGGINKILFGASFSNPFISSAERTGAAIFRKELNFARNRLLEEMSRADKNVDPRELLFKSYSDYALPVKGNVDFIRELENTAKEDSFLVKDYPQVLDEFSDIIGGGYITESNGMLYFKPTGTKLKLVMGESSSAVRSLLDIGFYLRHAAEPGDLLMVDEPELNLHPRNQRRIARLFARLVNLGIKVFITTHSDYIVKELNTLIMLNHDRPHLKRIAEEEEYDESELVAAEKIKVYMAEESLIEVDGNQRRVRRPTLVPADIDPEMGIEVRTFDETINKMNEIQEAIVWGED